MTVSTLRLPSYTIPLIVIYLFIALCYFPGEKLDVLPAVDNISIVDNAAVSDHQPQNISHGNENISFVPQFLKSIIKSFSPVLKPANGFYLLKIQKDIQNSFFKSINIFIRVFRN